MLQQKNVYGVATISRLLKIIGLFCKRALEKRQYSAKETCNFKEHTNRSHPISMRTETFFCQKNDLIRWDETIIYEQHKIIGLFCRISSAL